MPRQGIYESSIRTYGISFPYRRLSSSSSMTVAPRPLERWSPLELNPLFHHCILNFVCLCQQKKGLESI